MTSGDQSLVATVVDETRADALLHRGSGVVHCVDGAPAVVVRHGARADEAEDLAGVVMPAGAATWCDGDPGDDVPVPSTTFCDRVWTSTPAGGVADAGQARVTAPAARISPSAVVRVLTSLRVSQPERGVRAIWPRYRAHRD